MFFGLLESRATFWQDYFGRCMRQASGGNPNHCPLLSVVGMHNFSRAHAHTQVDWSMCVCVSVCGNVCLSPMLTGRRMVKSVRKNIGTIVTVTGPRTTEAKHRYSGYVHTRKNAFQRDTREKTRHVTMNLVICVCNSRLWWRTLCDASHRSHFTQVATRMLKPNVLRRIKTAFRPLDVCGVAQNGCLIEWWLMKEFAASYWRYCSYCSYCMLQWKPRELSGEEDSRQDRTCVLSGVK